MALFKDLVVGLLKEFADRVSWSTLARVVRLAVTGHSLVAFVGFAGGILLGLPSIEMLGRPFLITGPLAAAAGWTFGTVRPGSRRSSRRVAGALLFVALALLAAVLVDVVTQPVIVSTVASAGSTNVDDESGELRFVAKALFFALRLTVGYTLAAIAFGTGLALLFVAREPAYADHTVAARFWRSMAAFSVLFTAALPFMSLFPVLHGERGITTFFALAISTPILALTETRPPAIRSRSRAAAISLLIACVLLLGALWVARAAWIVLGLLDKRGFFESHRDWSGIVAVACALIPAAMYGYFAASFARGVRLLGPK